MRKHSRFSRTPFYLAAAMLGMAGGLGACEDAGDDTADAIEDAADDVGDAVDDAIDEVDDAIDDE